MTFDAASDRTALASTGLQPIVTFAGHPTGGSGHIPNISFRFVPLGT